MEFWKNALDLRKQITEWMMRDFGTKKNMKHIQSNIKGMAEEDVDTVNSILARYGRSPKQLQSVYPEWFIAQEIKFLNKELFELCENIAHANSIYISFDVDKTQRRGFQNNAIGNCYTLLQEIQFIIIAVGTDVNQLGDIVSKIEREISLLKGWKKADSKRKTEENKG